MAGFDRDTDERLLAATARGEREAFSVFYRRHLAAVVALLLNETHDRELAADLASEVFAAALAEAGRYRPLRQTALPWLCSIARNKARDSRRRGKAEERARRRLGIPRESLDDHDLERVVDLAAAGGQILALAAELPSAQHAALCARVVEERAYRDIAVDAGTSEILIRARVSRALAWLRAKVKETAV